MKSLRWGLMSTADINRKIIPAIRASKDGNLTSVASREKSRAIQYAQKWSIPYSFGSYDEMLSSDTVDIVYIGLPNHLHAEWSIKAMQTGKHVLCEKPLAISIAEVDQMAEVSKQSNCILMEAFMYLYHPQSQIIEESIRIGAIGDIFSIFSVFTFKLNDPQNVRLIPEYGGGCLWDVGVYPLSFSQFIYGDSPKSVYGVQVTSTSGVDEIFIGQLSFSGNRSAQITSSFRSSYQTFVNIIGTKGQMFITRPFSEMERKQKVILYPERGLPREISVPKKELYLGQIETMHNAILIGIPPRISLEESRNHIRTVIALYESAKTGMPVLLH